MHFWNNQSVVSKEAFLWRCINFSDFSHFLERVFILQSTKNLSKSHSWTCFLLLLMAGVKETFHYSHESFCHSGFWELSSEKVFQKRQKSLKLVHFLKIDSLETRLRWSIKDIEWLQKPILSNGPHLGSLQWAQKVTRTQNGVTVKPYIISLIDCHPVYPICIPYNHFT